MKLTFGVKNVIKFIIALLPVFYTLYMIHIIIDERSETTSLYSFFVGLVFLLIILIFSVKNAVNQIVPKYLKVMRAVNKYITFSELGALVKEEVFAPLELPASIKSMLSKSAIKEFEKGLLISQNWVYAYKVMIPKKMIVSIGVRCSHYRNIFCCNLVSKSNYDFASIRLDSNKHARLLTDYFGRCFGVDDRINATKSGELIEKFKKEVRTKEEFLKYII